MRQALVVDDSKAMRTILGGILRDLGFTVAEAKDGDEALTRLRSGPVTLALVDWNMPGMDGLSLIQAIRADHSLDPVKLLIVSTESKPAKVACMLEAGANEYVMKPFTRDALREKLAMIGVHAGDA